jgi:sugar/nucleoside kinase (ribokinase family)
MERVDYLVVGHVSCDLTPEGSLVGGTVAYSGRTAHALGCDTAVLTSAAPDCDLAEALPHLQTHAVPAPNTTSFENIYTREGRRQKIHSIAQKLKPEHVPEEWQRARIVHLAPIANEVAPEMIHLFSNSLVGLTPQGWLRRWDEHGRVYPREWPEAPAVLPLAAAVVLSQEDVVDETMLAQYRQWTRLLVLTQGADGCTIFLDDERRHFAAPPVPEAEVTGAGDIFAAAFLVRLRQTAGNPWEAARFANEIASHSVLENGLDAKIAQIRRVQNVSLE